VLLTEAIGGIAVSAPDRPAVTDPSGTTTYAELLRQAAGHLRVLSGIPADQPVASLLTGRGQQVSALLGAAAGSRMLVPLNVRLSDYELVAILADCGAALLLTERCLAERAAQVAAAAPLRPRVELVDDIEPRDPELLRKGLISPRDRVACFYTSGAEGTPRGAVLTHGNLASTVDTLRHLVPIEEDDVFLALSPVWHVYALTVGCLLPLSIGAHCLICPSMSLECSARAIDEHRATFVVTIPMALSRLAQAGPDTQARSLRHCICGGDRLSLEVMSRFEGKFGITVTEGYGCAEATAAVACNPFDSSRRPGWVGLPLPNQRVQLVDDHGSAAPTGDVGEVVVRGPNVMSGYLGKPVDTREVMRDGWLHTGDLARRSPDGFLQIVGRKRDVVVVDGQKVHASQVERVLLAVDGVADCCVIGMPDRVLGQVPKALIVVAQGADPSDELLRTQCEAHLAEFEVPRAFVRVEKLPKTTAGRLSRATATRMYGSSLS